MSDTPAGDAAAMDAAMDAVVDAACDCAPEAGGGDEFSPFWLTLGFIAQASFAMRFVVQWVASERARASVVPIAFWFFSMGGGVLLLTYAIHRRDPVFIAGQGLGLVIYLRNLWLIFRKKPEGRPPHGADSAAR